MVNTFLFVCTPQDYNDIVTPSDLVLHTARHLDRARLGKQRVEAVQIIKALEKGTGWANHTVTCMWRGYTNALKYYTNVIIREWINRGYNNTMPYQEVDEEEYSWN